MVDCITVYGERKLVPAEKLEFRPSVYGLIIQDDKILLIKTSITGKYSLPGGGIDPGESRESTLKREIAEETGLEVEIERFVCVKEDFFYFDPWDRAFHSFLFFYTCKPITSELLGNHRDVEDVEEEEPVWVDLKSLQPSDFQASMVRLFPEVMAEL